MFHTGSVGGVEGGHAEASLGGAQHHEGVPAMVVMIIMIMIMIGPLLFVLDEAPLQHKILNFGLFQAKTYANGL